MNFREFAHRQFSRMFDNPDVTLLDLRKALNEVGEAVLQDIKLSDVNTHTPTKKHNPEEPKSVLDQAVNALRTLEDWVTAEDLAEMIGSSSTYVSRVLMDDIKDNRESRVIVKYFKIHNKGRPTPHYQYVPVPNS